MNYQLRLELQGAVNQWVESFMSNNGISPSMMDDALSKALLRVRELALQEYIAQAQAQAQRAQTEEEQNEQNNEDTVEQ